MKPLFKKAASSFTFVSFMSLTQCTVYGASYDKEIALLKGGDPRFFRWDASEETAEQQDIVCPKALPKAIKTIISGGKDAASAAELVALCVTDNPANRELLSKSGKAAPALVKMLQSDKTAAVAAHVIWIASYNNHQNLEAFEKAGAVDALSKIVLSNDANSALVMWAAAALQNLSANYCSTHGWCNYDWNDPHTLTPDEEETGTITVDTSNIRTRILGNVKLVDRLIALVCAGPIKGRLSEKNIPPGDAEADSYKENSGSVIAWAAAGVVKNLALDPSAVDKLEPHMACYCRLAQSRDWLEQAKAESILHHLRPSDPCWFDWSGDDEPPFAPLCVDRVFVDDDEYTCSDYDDDMDEDECKVKDVKTGVAASYACCACGGGEENAPIGRGTSDEL